MKILERYLIVMKILKRYLIVMKIHERYLIVMKIQLFEGHRHIESINVRDRKLKLEMRRMYKSNEPRK